MKTHTSFPLLQIQKRKGIAGAVIACLVLAVCCIWFSWKIGAVFAAMFLGAGFLKINPKYPLSQFLLNAFWGILCIFVSCFLPTQMVSYSNFFSIGSYRILMNFLCVTVVYGIFLTITGEIKRAVVIASSLLMVMSTANAFLFQFRGNELKPMDFISIGTALNVAGQYTFRVQSRMLYGWLLWVWMLFCLWALPPAHPVIPKNLFRLAAAAASVACAVFLWHGTVNIHTATWNDEGSTINGYFLNFFTGIRDCFVEEPENYTPEAVDALASGYTDAGAAPAGDDLPNIIVIMNESFADFEILGSELRTNQPVTPFLDSLEENTIRGYALASVFGGGTANSEFEFLTGHSMANMPEGSVPYQQYIGSDTYSLAWLLGAYGYKSIATHPYNASGWNRLTVYPYFGFSSSTFVDSYPKKNLIRKFVSDQEMYESILSTLEEPRQQPLFLFGITMQNHGDYIYTGDNYEQTIRLDGYEWEYPMAEQYLTLLHESDKAIEYLLSELESYPEDTVVLFFGDHFPKVEGDFFLEVHGSEFETLSERMLQYQVPFFIWANYDIPEQAVECTSLNYLGRYLLEAAGLELPPYYRFLKDLEASIPAVNALGYYSVSQQTFLPLDAASGEESEWLNRYAIIQYNSLFDSGHRSQLFFEQYIN